MIGKLLGLGVLAALALFIALGSYYTVGENERVVLLRFGEAVEITGPGAHAKLPFVNSVHRFSTEMDSVALSEKGPGINVYTVDNQELDVKAAAKQPHKDED